MKSDELLRELQSGDLERARAAWRIACARYEGGRLGPALMQAFYNVEVSPDTGCWEWQRSRTRDGYAKAYKGWRVQRAIFEVSGYPLGYKIVMHSCDNPPCINPAHLSAGTTRENAWDCVRRGRKAAVRGSAMTGSKLSEREAALILSMSARGISQTAIAAHFSVSQSCISLILSGKRWPHITTL